MVRWAEIPGWPGYEASTDGRVRSVDRVITDADGRRRRMRGRTLSSERQLKGYPAVILSVGGEKRDACVHVLVAEAFLGRREGRQVRHLDGDRMNNRLDNLVWGTAAENAADRERHGRTARAGRSGCAKLTAEQVEQIRAAHPAEPLSAIAKRFGVAKSTVHSVVRGETWRTQQILIAEDKVKW